MKERDDAPDPEPKIEHTGPFLVTPKAMAALQEQLAGAKDAAEKQALQYRISVSNVVEPPPKRDEVRFGATVTVELPKPPGKQQIFTLVDESEVDVPTGKIGLESPLGQALTGAHVAQEVVWHRPAGDMTVIVRKIEYE